jgi:hypothetical protein
VAPEARSELQQAEVYGRKPSDGAGRFFQRVYDGAALEALCAAVAPRLGLASCTIVRWPDHALMRLQPRFPVAVGFAGLTFPWLANRFVVGEPAPAVPDIQGPGDAVLTFTRTAEP